MRTRITVIFTGWMILLLSCQEGRSQVVVGPAGVVPDSSAMLAVKVTGKGFLPPRMSRQAMLSIVNPAQGLMVFCSDCKASGVGAMCIFRGNAWQEMEMDCLLPAKPEKDSLSSTQTQIVWRWKQSPGATGYLWNTVNDSFTATAIGNVTTRAEAGLSCGTPHYRYLWARNDCGASEPLVLDTVTQVCTEYPVVKTDTVSGLELTSAVCGGNVTATGSSAVTARGVCWNTQPYPTTSNNKTTNGSGTGAFTGNITGLSVNTTYYVRAYATNGQGTSYGNQVTFTTPCFAPGYSYGGGIIIWVDTTGQHGLIAATSDLDDAKFGCWHSLISGTSTKIGSGMANTLAIVNGCSEPACAARLCHDLVLNGYNDWYLPSLQELELVFNNSSFFQWLDGHYWSSSEFNSDYGWTLINNFSIYRTQTKKNILVPVKAVRSF